MGDKGVGGAGDDVEPSYQVIAYNAYHLPAQYRALVLARWLNSLKQGNDYFKLIDRDSYFKIYNLYVKNLCLKPTATVRLACLSDEPDTVLGFSVIEGPTLHYVHVLDKQRQQGIARSLLTKDLTHTTHMTKHGIKLWTKEAFRHIKFDPFKG